MCYQGHQGGSYEMDGPIPGDGACASCTTSADDAACLSCFEGFQLEAADPGSCTGRCVPEQAARPVAAGCAHRADQKCGVAPSTALCHDLHPSCGWRAALDPGFCNQARPERAGRPVACAPPPAPTPGSSPSSSAGGPGSPWAPARPSPGDGAGPRWPGVELSGASLGGFLSALHLEDFGFRGPLEPGWAHLAQPLGRMSWDLSHNRATGTLPPEWSAVLPRLSSLDLSRNALRGTLPAAWALASAAAPAGGLAINLGLNSLSGALPPAWLARGRLRSVTDLNLEGNRLTGTIPADWSALGSRLWALSLAGNRVAGTLPSELSAFAGARVLRFGSNALTGTLPPEYSAMIELKSMEAEDNALSGTLPAEWSAVEAWDVIWSLSGNRLTGTIPACWSAVSLQRLEIQNNSLSGPLPDQLSAVPGLMELDLSDNGFSGTLPASWSTLTTLRRVNLARNRLHGTIPAEWSALRRLDVLRLSGNALLEGGVPLDGGVEVSAGGTLLRWNASAELIWNKHEGRWHRAHTEGQGSDDGPSSEGGGGGWTQDDRGQCSFCRLLPDPSDKCGCIRDCCSTLGDKSLCKLDYDRILGTENCGDPCSYCWGIPSVADRSACFNSCCAPLDDDDAFPLRSQACRVSREGAEGLRRH
eukprot:CAMPEP_0177578260 /NCGR_PEP_ID=MMETSP0419_2-20121207/246_1 /TAXON_ID=582737 /ORGANISM="Tetraselmis sp., Strain GSL018" /LENGTH=644 /DNA_ID=CAMNT_0019066677 /DNA_START=1037 /DNA_END=2972 /DNA_ORIENTATION=+